MAKVAQLIAGLEAEGKVESHGEFTLDRDKAKLKMRQFQLADPHRYVLVLVQAAVLKGASRIQFEIDADDMRMNFDGDPFVAEDLDELYTSLFGNRMTPTIHARQELAVALNAAMGLNPRYIKLESGDGERGVKLELRPDKEDLMLAAPGVPAGTRIHVKDQFRPGLLVRFFRDLRGEILEEKQLREHCRWALTPIELDGKLISQKPALARATGRVAVRSPEVSGIAGFVQDERWQPRAQLLNNGVWLAEHELKGFPLGFQAVVDGSSLKKDVSQTDVVRDAAYARVVTALRQACDEALVLSVDHYLLHGDVWLASVIKEALFRIAPAIESGLGHNRVVDALSDVPLWMNTAGRWLSTRQLLAAENPGYCVKSSAPVQLDPGVEIVRAVEEGEQRFFSVLAGGRVRDRTGYLRRMVERERNRKAWREREQAPRLPTGHYLARVPVQFEDVRGELGLDDAGAEKASIRLVLDGCLLYELNPKFPFPGLAAVLEAPLTPRANYTAAQRDEVLARCVRALAEGLLSVFTGLARAHRQQPLTNALRRTFMAYLIAVTTPGFRGWLFKQFEFASRTTKRHLGNMGRWADQPRWGIAQGEPHPLAQLRLFDTVDGQVLSLAELGAALEKDGSLVWIARDEPPVASPERLVIRLTERPLRLLQEVFGEDKLVDFTGEYEQWVERERFRLRPRDSLQLDRWVHEQVSFEGEGLHGAVGLAEFVLGGASEKLSVADEGLSVDMLRARVLHEDRWLCDHWFTVGIPGLVATVAGGAVVSNASYNDLEGDTWLQVARALDAPVAQLIGKLSALYASRELPDPVRYALMLALRTTFTTPGTVHVYSHLRQTLGDEAPAEYAALHGLSNRYTSEAVSRQAQKLRRNGQAPTAAAVEQALRGRGMREHEWYEPESRLRVALAGVLRLLAAVPLFPAAGQAALSFDALLDLRMRGRLRRVDRQSAAQIRYDGSEAILVADEVVEHVLERLFGEQGIEDGRPWLEAWDTERQLAGRAQLEQLRVPAGAMLAVLELEGELAGEIGLPRARPFSDVRSFVQLCKDRRLACTVNLVHVVPVSAVLDWDGLELEQRPGVGLAATAASTKWVASRIEDSIDALMDVLAAKSLSNTAAAEARVYVLRYLAARLQKAGRAGQLDPHGPLSRVAAFPVFEDVDGNLHSLLDLRRHYAGRGSLSYLTTTPFVRPRDRIVVLARQDELPDWHVLFPKLVDFSLEHERERELRRRKATLRPLAEAPPRHALAVRRVDAHGLEGLLWLESRLGERAEVDFGGDRLRVGSVVLDEALRCHGAIAGPGVHIDDAWEDFEVDAKGVAHLRDLVLEMYEELVEVGRAEAGAGDAATGRSGAVAWILRAVARPEHGLVRILRHTLIGLEAARESSRLPERERALYRRLVDLPLFELATGQLISLRTAERERPTELAHWGLWRTPMPDTSDAGADALVAGLAEASGPERRHEPGPPWPLPEPPSPASRPAELLLGAIRAELRLVRTGNQNLLSDAHLELIRLDEGSSEAVEIRDGLVQLNQDHPMFRTAQSSWREDPLQVSLWACLVYSALNVLLEEISDQHEQLFHRVHAVHVLSRLLMGRPGPGPPVEES